MLNIEDIIAVRCDTEEQETTITYSRKESQVHIYTSDNTVLTKLKKLMAKDDNIKCVEVTYNQNHEPTGYFFTGTKKNVGFKTTRNKKILTPEEKKIIRQRFIKTDT